MIGDVESKYFITLILSFLLSQIGISFSDKLPRFFKLGIIIMPLLIVGIAAFNNVYLDYLLISWITLMTCIMINYSMVWVKKINHQK